MLAGIEGVSTFSGEIDKAFYIVNGITLLLFVVTVGAMLYFLFKYSAKKNPPEKTKNIEHYTPIEVAWTVIPSILLGIIFYYGVESLKVQRTMPSDDDSIVVKVLGQRWSWNFEYPNGKKTTNMVIPVNQNVKLLMTAPENDVLHSFFVPAFRVKEDVVPGQTTRLWFNIEKEGKYDIECAEYCGTRHSYMHSFIEVVSENEYKEWLNPKNAVAQPKGLELMNQYGCVSCHSFDGTVLVGPSLGGVFNKKVTVTTGSEKRELVRDESYLSDAILDPNKDIVDGFSTGLMPEFKDRIKEDELKEIIDYIKSMSGAQTNEASKKVEKVATTQAEPKGKMLLQNNGCTGCHSLDGTKVVGPTLKGIYNRKEKVMEGKTLKEIVADEEYIKTAILKPKDSVVEGYPDLMPPFENILSDEDTNTIIEYLKTLN